MISLEGKAGCHDKMLLLHKKIWTFFPIRAKYFPALKPLKSNGLRGLSFLVHILHIMLENSKKGYHMVEKSMHNHAHLD